MVLGDEPGVTVEFLADPLSLAALQPYASPDVELVGDVRGPVSARGLFSDLRVIADLRTPRGLVNFDGRFDLMAEDRRYDARLTARDIQLRQWVEQAPATRLAVEGRVPVEFLGRTGGGVPRAGEIDEKVRAMMGGS